MRGDLEGESDCLMTCVPDIIVTCLNHVVVVYVFTMW